jgi:deoxyribodipyrimidine photo-lyase
VRLFDRGALQDAASRAEAGGAPIAELLADVTPDDLAAWATRAGAAQIVTAWAPIGPVRDFLDRARAPLEAAGVRLAMIRRPWDDAVWRYADAGFFKVKKQIPKLIAALQ